MPEDYEQSAIRHYEDVTSLRNGGRRDNSGHLIGFAAECAIKFRIVSLRPGTSSPHGHLPDLLIAARKQMGPRNAYVSMYAILKNHIFSTWHVNRRYHASGSTSESELDEWFAITRRLLASAGIKLK